VRIARAASVSDPLVVSGVNVWNVGMASPVHFDVVLGRWSGLPPL
jgi:hypothetical protein